MPPKEPDSASRARRRLAGPRSKPSRPIRRLVIWYRRNAAVTSLVGTASGAASGAASVAVEVATEMAGAAGSVAGSVLQP
ncbi:MAG: phosphate acyltransferase PlsX, partial [Synechococcaceae cyanobacterium]